MNDTVSLPGNGHRDARGLGELLSLLAERVARLESERNQLTQELHRIRESELERARKLYRRGYRAGYATGRRGADPETAPERHARGWARQLLHQ